MPHGYSLREVVEILGIPRGVVEGFVDAGFVAPWRGARREYRFAFADLVVMRAAKGLVAAEVPPQRLTRALRRLREQLPADVPRRGLRIESDGSALVVSEGGSRWRADSGQYVLAFEVAPAGDTVRFVDAAVRQPSATPVDAGQAMRWLERGMALEVSRPDEACDAYRRAIAAAPTTGGAYVNLGRLLHQRGRLPDARAVYEEAIANGVVDATLAYNLGVVLEDLGLPADAAACYERAIALDAAFADAHYNLALLHEACGRERQALRHFSAYRQLTRNRR